MLTALEHLCVGVVNGHVKPKSLKENVLIIDQLLGLFHVLLQLTDGRHCKAWKYGACVNLIPLSLTPPSGPCKESCEPP